VVRGTRTLGNALAELPPTLDWLEAALRTAGIGAAIVGELRLVAEEALSNVIRHGYADSAWHSIEVTLEIGGGEIWLTLRDDGRPFNPLAAPARDPHNPIAERAGGWGIHLLQSLVDRADYRREGSANVLRLVKRSE
jgi:anti-sigma regulatory factor (Ser/Thr protein kinase)